jgi:UTP--glucose-1-phosphate uridylyltransferase
VRLAFSFPTRSTGDAAIAGLMHGARMGSVARIIANQKFRVELKKAIITAAGRDQRSLPLQTLVDRNGESKAALRIIVEEALQAGAEEVCVVVHPGDAEAYRTAAGEHAVRVQFVEQHQPQGYGHAVWCARKFAAGQPFLLLVGDHLHVSHAEKRCAQQLAEVARAQNCSVSAVQSTHESKLPYYGAVGGKLVAGGNGLYEIGAVLEKPTPTEAEQKLDVPGLRAGHYLCFFGLHALSPAVMDYPDDAVTQAAGKERVQFTPALAKLAARERYLACEVSGRRYDMGVKYGQLTAQLALALDGAERDEVLANLVELLALRNR